MQTIKALNPFKRKAVTMKNGKFQEVRNIRWDDLRIKAEHGKALIGITCGVAITLLAVYVIKRTKIISQHELVTKTSYVVSELVKENEELFSKFFQLKDEAFQ